MEAWGRKGRLGFHGSGVRCGRSWPSAVFGAIFLAADRLGRRQSEVFYARLREAVQLGLAAAEEGASQERFNVRVEDQYGTARHHRRALVTAAKTAFAWGGQGPSQTSRPTN
jgi:hypothetical protein